MVSNNDNFIIPAQSANRLIRKSFVSTNKLKGEFGTKYSNYKGHIKNQAAYQLATERFYEKPELDINENVFYKI